MSDPHKTDDRADASVAHYRPQRAFHYRNIYWLWLSLAVIVSDQITKQLVVNNLDLYERVVLGPMLNLTRMHNTGAAFSILADTTPFFFVALALAVSIGIVIWLRRHPDGERLTAVSLSLILGGALGNAIDRATRGYVIDFIDVHAAGWHWPAFNVADCAITVGALLIVLDMLVRKGEGGRG